MNSNANEKPDNDLYTILFEEAPIGLGLSNMEGELLMYNKMLLKISGFTAEEIKEIKYVSKLYYDPKDREFIIAKVTKNGYIDQYPVKFKKKDGSYFESLMSLRRVNYQGKPHFLAIVTDMTEKLATEKKVAEKVKELEQVNQFMIGRELGMAELKNQIKDLEKKLLER